MNPAWSSTVQERLFNPQPAEGDLVLPMPDGAMMVFRRVAVPGSGFWGDESRIIQMGDATGGMFEGLRRMQIAGSFRDTSSDQWHFWLAKYELNVAQFVAVMGFDELVAVSGDESVAQIPELGGRERLERLAQPLTYVSAFDIQRFVHRYNRWLFDPEHPERRAALPALDNVPGFLRLPTEEEWAYAARGGEVALKAGHFNDRLPFDPARLDDFAWHLGNARHQLRPIGLRSPDALGLHDMLGNAQELTGTRFRPELGQGKPGGITVRGGSVSTPAAEMRSALRAELDEYGWDPDAQQVLVRRSFNTGVRLAIGSNVVLDAEQQARIEQEYEAYRERMRAQTPAGRSMNNLVAQASGQLGDMDALLEELISRNPDLAGPLGSVREQAEQARIQLAQAERLRARSLLQDAARNGVNLSVHLSRLTSLDSARETAAELAELSTRYEARLRETEQLIERQNRAIDEQLAGYGTKLAALADTEPAHVDAAFEALQAQEISAREAAVMELLAEHVSRYRELRRPDQPGWLAQFRETFAEFDDEQP
ncbi:MAG: SUMF1/EgtB/PvdO family nonheme iron enzyme [Halothiobacillaceae bacterium]